MSEDFLEVEVLANRKRIADIEFLPDSIAQALRERLETLMFKLRDLVEDNIRTRLNSVSGNLAENVEVEIIDEGLSISGRVYISGVPYAQAQESGGFTPAHYIYPQNGKILAFMAASGDKVFATRVFHPGARIPAKHFMRDAYREISPKITNSLYYYMVRKLRSELNG